MAEYKDSDYQEQMKKIIDDLNSSTVALKSVKSPRVSLTATPLKKDDYGGKPRSRRGSRHLLLPVKSSEKRGSTASCLSTSQLEALESKASEALKIIHQTTSNFDQLVKSSSSDNETESPVGNSSSSSRSSPLNQHGMSYKDSTVLRSSSSARSSPLNFRYPQITTPHQSSIENPSSLNPSTLKPDVRDRRQIPVLVLPQDDEPNEEIPRPSRTSYTSRRLIQLKDSGKSRRYSSPFADMTSAMKSSKTEDGGDMTSMIRRTHSVGRGDANTESERTPVSFRNVITKKDGATSKNQKDENLEIALKAKRKTLSPDREDANANRVRKPVSLSSNAITKRDAEDPASKNQNDENMDVSQKTKETPQSSGRGDTNTVSVRDTRPLGNVILEDVKVTPQTPGSVVTLLKNLNEDVPKLSPNTQRRRSTSSIGANIRPINTNPRRSSDAFIKFFSKKDTKSISNPTKTTGQQRDLETKEDKDNVTLEKSVGVDDEHKQSIKTKDGEQRKMRRKSINPFKTKKSKPSLTSSQAAITQLISSQFKVFAPNAMGNVTDDDTAPITGNVPHEDTEQQIDVVLQQQNDTLSNEQISNVQQQIDTVSDQQIDTRFSQQQTDVAHHQTNVKCDNQFDKPHHEVDIKGDHSDSWVDATTISFSDSCPSDEGQPGSPTKPSGYDEEETQEMWGYLHMIHSSGHSATDAMIRRQIVHLRRENLLLRSQLTEAVDWEVQVMKAYSSLAMQHQKTQSLLQRVYAELQKGKSPQF